MSENPPTPVDSELKTVKVVVALAKGMAPLQEALSEAVQEVNQKALEENRGAHVEIVERREEGAYPGFYRESPRTLIERIRDEGSPDIIIAVFHARFGAEILNDAGSSTREFDRFAQTLRQPDSPHILLYFLDKDFNPQGPEEKAQVEYFRDFRSYFIPNIGKLWWWFKNKAALRKRVYEELWEFVRLHTQSNSSLWIDKPSLDLSLPEGWQHINEDFLDKERGKLEADNRLSPEDAASFFDGELPKWRHIVSQSIRPRERVAELVKELTENAAKGRTRVTLLVGPGGEGKSTILQQVAVSLVENHDHINVIWRDPKATRPARLEKVWLQPLLKQEQQFLFVIDSADLIVEDIWESVVYLSDQPSNIHFLLASRSLDWEWSRAESKPWRRTLGGTNYQPKEIRALSEEDARRIVQAWEDAGEKGLGNFIKEEPGERASKLFKLAKEEERKNPREGSFLGAMLEARKSDTFRDYVGDILRRLEGRTVPGDKRLQLQDAFKYIIALHADDQLILTRPVLRHLLGCSMDELEQDVIQPLVDEADVSSSTLVLTRHIAIARAARQILAEEFRVKFETQTFPVMDSPAVRKFKIRTLPVMADAAIRKFKTRDREMKKEHLSPWNKLPRYYANQLRQVDVALSIAEALADAEPEDPQPIITWAGIHRHDGQLEEAVSLFRTRYAGISADKLNKGFFAEWATAESMIKNYCHDAWLTGIALSDLIAAKHPGDDMPMIILSGLTSAFLMLYEKSADPHDAVFYQSSNAQTFLRGCAAAAQLGLDERVQKGYSDNDKRESAKYLKRGRKLGADNNVPAVTTDEAINRISSGVMLAWELRDKDKDWDQIPPTLPSAHKLSFRTLRAIFKS